MGNPEHTFRYAQSTKLVEQNEGCCLQLSASQEFEKNTAYFEGKLTYPMESARCLRAISLLVGARYYVPPGMLAKILREADPVVTASRRMLRFEGFSSCCSAYGRLDITEGGFTAEKIVPGTTNVDFQAEMRAALSKVRSNSAMDISLRSDGFELVTEKDSVVERKVALPQRWLKGFSEVQAQQVDMSLRFTVNRSDAVRFLRQLPKAKSQHPVWVVPAAKGLRLAHRETKGGVRLKGFERLRVLEDLVSLSESLRIYTDSNHSMSAWVLSLGPQRFTLVLSAEPSRGFSGEGQLLTALASRTNELVLAKVKSSLNWQEAIPPDELAVELHEDPKDVITALSLLASRGLVGFDVYTGKYFHRVLPFDLSAVEQLHPRLKGARKIVGSSGVTIISEGEKIVADVCGGDVIHRVYLSSEGDRCSCPWYAKHLGDRGPCKHVVATHIVIEESK